MVPRWLASAAILTILLGSSIACERLPTGATPPPTGKNPIPTNMANVSGIVWLHYSEGVKPHAGATLYGWIETPRSGGPAGRVFTDSNGQYLFRVPVGSRIRIYQGPPPYQPCEVTIAVDGDVSRDVHAVSDPRQLGANLPPPLRSQLPVISGFVFETTAEGPRPLSNVLVYSDSTGSGGDVVTASTLTDSDGRYLLCGLEGNTSASVQATKPGYGLFGQAVMLTGNSTTVEIQLRRLTQGR